jgi:hypothetical protein
VGILFVLREGERLLSILLFQQPRVLEWDLDGGAFEETVAEGIYLAFLCDEAIIRSAPSR